MATVNKRLISIILGTFLILSIPMIVMQFNDQVNWSLADFFVAGVLLLGSGLTIEFILRKVQKRDHQILIIISVLLVLITVWVELAVGIFGTPFAGS